MKEEEGDRKSFRGLLCSSTHSAGTAASVRKLGNRYQEEKLKPLLSTGAFLMFQMAALPQEEGKRKKCYPGELCLLVDDFPDDFHPPCPLPPHCNPDT